MSLSKQAAYDQRQKDKGQRRIAVWVYEEDRQAVLNYAKKKRSARERTMVAG